jgi:hypothetical protein
MIRPVHETVVMFAFATRVRRVGVSKLCPQHAERRINPSKTVTIPVLTGARLLLKNQYVSESCQKISRTSHPARSVSFSFGLSAN